LRGHGYPTTLVAMIWLRRTSVTAVACAACWLVLLTVVAAGCGSDPEPPAQQAVEDSGPAETGKPFADAGTPPVVGPAVECQLGAAIETEPNDTPPSANAFTELSFCGVLSTPQDVDYATFDTPPGTKLGLFQAVIDGRVDFELALKGATFGPAETTKFGSGTYLIKAFTTSGKTASYRFRVQFDPI
jgi:hypothetical protein